MNIAICDDILSELEQIEKITYECAKESLTDIECDCFCSGEELLNHLNQKDFERYSYQIYLLDIEMKGMDGIKVAEKIRESDEKAIIIFETSHKELMAEAFEVLAFNFIVKPFEEGEVKRIILKAFKYVVMKNKILQFRFNRQSYSINCDDIMYIESSARKIQVFTEDKVYDYYCSIKKIIEQLNQVIFVQTHASYIVNLEYVNIFDGENIILKNGIKIPLSRKHYKCFNAKYRSFVLMRM